MKKALLLLVTIMLWSCSDRNEDIVIDGELHMSVDELPRIDCSTSTQPLGMILAAMPTKSTNTSPPHRGKALWRKVAMFRWRNDFSEARQIASKRLLLKK